MGEGEPKGKLYRQWRGHMVTVSPEGLAIDGRSIDRTTLKEADACPPSADPRQHPSLQFLDSGALVYRGRVQADVHPTGVTFHGPDGAAWPPLADTTPADELDHSDDEIEM